MSFVIQITDQAEADIDRNAIWWADNHSVAQAITWIQTIRQPLKALSTIPERFDTGI